MKGDKRPEKTRPRSRTDLIGRTSAVFTRDRMATSSDRLLVGFSGGIDSATLLYVLTEVRREIPFDLAVAHVNHRLRRGESDRDESFTGQVAERYGLPYFLERADVKGYAAANGLSLQHAGRDIRYRFFNETADREGYTKIVLAHNLDDQVETFLLRLIKGTGLRGLSAMPPVRDRVIRPFLDVYRSQIEAFAVERSIPYVQDSSNAKTVYERNFVRHDLMPLLARLNPAFREKIVSVLKDIRSIDAILDRKKEAFLADCASFAPGEVTAPAAPVRELDEETRFRVLSDILGYLSPHFVPLREHIRLIDRVLLSSRPNLSLNLPSRLRMIKEYDTLRFTSKQKPAADAQSFPLHEGTNRIPLRDMEFTLKVLKRRPAKYPDDPLVACFDLDKLKDDLSVRTFRNGDRFVPLGMEAPVKVKDFFISRKIALEERKTTPLLVSGNDIVWVVGHRIDGRFRVTDASKRVLKVTAHIG